MIKLDENLLTELGLGSLPKPEKTAFLKHMYETLEMRVGTRLAERMSDQQMVEFEQFIKSNDEQGAFHWLETNFPNYKEVVAEEFEKLKGEIRPLVPQIVAASQAQAAQIQAQAPQQSGMPAGQPPYDVPPSPAASFGSHVPQPSQQAVPSSAFDAPATHSAVQPQSFQPSQPAPSFGQSGPATFSAPQQPSQMDGLAMPGNASGAQPFSQSSQGQAMPVAQSSPYATPSQPAQPAPPSFDQPYNSPQFTHSPSPQPSVPTSHSQPANPNPYGPPPSFGQPSAFGQPGPAPAPPFEPDQDQPPYGPQQPHSPPSGPGQ